MEAHTDLQPRLLRFQRNEITEHHVYSQLAAVQRFPENRAVLEKIAAKELHHYQIWKGYTHQDVPPNRFVMWFYYLVSRLFGFTFGVKLMEIGEGNAQRAYAGLEGIIPDIQRIIRDEGEHEMALIAMLDEQRLHYAGSVVLGLNDALVELTGALAGLTLAFQNTRLIALSGLITGIAAALSMGASEYLSTRSEKTDKNPLKAAFYTGVAYIITVALLILPYLLFSNYYLCLALALMAAVLVIAVFNFYISVAKDLPFRRRFLEMAVVSLGVAALSFVLGYLIRQFLGVDI